MKGLIAVVLWFAVAGSAYGQGVSVSASDTTQSVVAAQKGKRITVRLRSGQEISGTVRDVTDRLVVIGEISGKEFFDAVIRLDDVEAVLIRTRTQ